jgi:osmotically-inducible protein OsmY
VEDVMYRSETRPEDQQRFGSDVREREQDDYHGERNAARSGQSGSAEQPGDRNQRRSRGNWTGYVVPYRYYGNGYAGVGYYSVMYQGPAEGGDESEGHRQGDFDQREVDYGQGQAAGAAWTGRWGTRRSSMGGQAGRGPKGYQRSDERLEEEVSDRLMADDWIDASDIEVRVKNGEVTLTGTVDDRLAKRRAEDIAEQVMGVRDVMNQIRVEPDSSSTRQSSQSRQSGSTRSTSSKASGRRSSRNGSRTTDQPTTASRTSHTDSTSAGTR